jgi:hypothetical protein
MPLTPNKDKKRQIRDFREFKRNPAPQSQEADPGQLAQLWARAVEPASYPWKPVPIWSLVVTSVCFTFLMYLLKTDLLGNHSFWMRGLHRVNLIFHEFGHPAFSFFGRTMNILGGTLGQLLIPLIVTVAFWRQRDTLGFAVGGFWFFENFMDVAVYMADAQVLLLPLIGGLGSEAHDWRNLFTMWGVLDKTPIISGTTNTLGWIGMFTIWIWLSWRWLCSDNT